MPARYVGSNPTRTARANGGSPRRTTDEKRWRPVRAFISFVKFGKSFNFRKGSIIHLNIISLFILEVLEDLLNLLIVRFTRIGRSDTFERSTKFYTQRAQPQAQVLTRFFVLSLDPLNPDFYTNQDKRVYCFRGV